KGAAVLGAVFEVGMAYWENKKEAEFVKQKEEMKQSLGNYFSEVSKNLGSTDDFIQNFIPTSNLIEKTIDDLKRNNDSFEKKLEESSVWKTKLFNFFDAEEVAFEEI